MTEVVSFDPYLKNAYSKNLSFDFVPKASNGKVPFSAPGDRFNPELSVQTAPSKEWEVDVRSLVSTPKWLSHYGLKQNKLDVTNILSRIGFRHIDGYDSFLKKPVCSRYGFNIFDKFLHPDGKIYNLSCSKEQLRQIELRLVQALSLYKKRLEWLTTESRRIFGVIEEKCLSIVLDAKQLAGDQFDQCRAALERVLREQVSQAAKFNLIRSSDKLESFQPECVPVSTDVIESVISWLWQLDPSASAAPTTTCEALLQAVRDPNVEAVYLFVEGSSYSGSHQLLKEKLQNSKVPIHIVSFNCTSKDSLDSLKELAKMTSGKFHAYGITMELDHYEGATSDSSISQANVVIRKKTLGGVPQGAGAREDVLLLFEEIEEARSILGQIQTLIDSYPDSKNAYELQKSMEPQAETSETYMGSKAWLARYGIVAKKLTLHDVLASVAFKHQDGVIDLKVPPPNESTQTDALTKQKLVHAKYCDRFPHIEWKDGEIVHVQVTPELHRNFEAKVNMLVDTIQNRINWLQKGSRELFGTIIEERVYFLIDTSASMEGSMQFVKDKFFLLMQEQLRHKRKLNVIAFDSRPHRWREHLMDTSEESLRDLWQWVQQLRCQGSTDTMGALRLALTDDKVQAIYLLTDGRPNQPPSAILAQAMIRPNVPVHTISFNCNDMEANQFLCQLAKNTGGRFHYYNYHGGELEGTEAWESEDIRFLKEEIDTAYDTLSQLTQLRDECAHLAWTKANVQSNTCSRKHSKTAVSSVTPRPLTSDSSMPRVKSAQELHHRPTPPPTATRPYSSRQQPSRSRARKIQSAGIRRSERLVSDPGLYVSPRSSTPSKAGQTRASVLRALSNNVDVSYLLPREESMYENEYQYRTSQEIRNKHTAKNKAAQKKRRFDKKLKYLPSHLWLKTHGLSARKLTIMDILRPTFVPHKYTHIPILQKNVWSKVFDEIMPLRYVTNEGTEINTVNPNCIDWDRYISSVEAAIQSYYQRLTTIIWESLPLCAKEELNPDLKPLPFEANRTALLEVLEKHDWPLAERNVILLEKEIKLGIHCIHQAKDLQEMSRSVKEEEDRAKKQKSPRKRGKKRIVDEDDVPLPLMPDGEIGEERGTSASPRENIDSPADPISRPHKPTPPATPLISHTRSPSPAINTKGSGKTLETLKGQTVIARMDTDGYYYPGKVDKCLGFRQVLVKFDVVDDLVEVPSRYTIAISGAIARPKLAVGDYVLTKMYQPDTDLPCYLPGVITIAPAADNVQRKHYTVRLFNKNQDDFVRSDLVKISKQRFIFTARYINDREKKHGSDVEDSKKTESESEEDDDEKESENLDEETTNLHERWRLKLERKIQEQKKEQKRLRRQIRSLEKLLRQREEPQTGKLLKDLIELMNAQQKEKSPRPKQSEMLGTAKVHHWKLNHTGARDEHQMEAEMRAVTNQEGAHLVLASGDHKPTAPVLLQLRTSLPELQVGQEVLARWSDEGWYYRSTIKFNCEDYSYILEDMTGDLEKIYREDILAEEDDRELSIQVHDTVVALHPSYTSSYAPAVVIDAKSDEEITVRFYDSKEHTLPRLEIYKIDRQKFEFDVRYIVQLEENWVGQAVIARDDRTGKFNLATVVKHLEDQPRHYVLEWASGEQVTQKAVYIFGAFTKRHPLAKGDYVLALANKKNWEFLPGQVLDGDEGRLDVRFADGTRDKAVDPQDCFWLSKNYFHTAVKYFQTCSST